MFDKTSFRSAFPALRVGVFLLLFFCLLCLSPALGDTTTIVPDANWVINEDTVIDAQVIPGKDIVITIAEGATLTINGSLTNGYEHNVTILGKGTLVSHGHHDDHNIYGIMCKDLVIGEGVTVKAFGARSTDSDSHAVYANTVTVRSGGTLYAWGGNSSNGTGGNGIAFLQLYSPCSFTLEGSAIVQASGGQSSDGSFGSAVRSYAFFGSAPPITLVNSMTGGAWTDIKGTQGELEIAAGSGQNWYDLVGTMNYPLVEFGIHHHYFEVTHTNSTLTLRCKKCGTDYTASLSDPSKVYDGAPAKATLTLSSDFTKEYTFGAMIWYGPDGSELESPPVNAGSYTVEVPVGYLGEVQFTLAVRFKITPAVPAILTPPAAESLVEGELLFFSDLTGGTAEVPGVFSWDDSSITPSLADSGVTPYTVIFTPDDSNYGPASTAVTVLVIPESKETVHIEPVEDPVHVIHDHHALSFATVGDPVENILPLLTDIVIDGHSLTEDEFTIVMEEVPILILNDDFLDTLSPGTHMLEEDFGDNIMANVVFEIKEEKVVPKTGDSAAPLLWVCIILLSLASLLLLRRRT